MAQRNSHIRGEQIADAFFGAALARNGTDENIADVQVDGSTIEITTDALNVKAAGITETQLNTSVAGDGLAGGGGTALSVNVDDATIGIVTDTLEVKDAGITETQLNTSVAGNGLAGGGGTALSVDLNELATETTFDEAADYIAFVDVDEPNGSNKILWSLIATQIAGSGITATDGVLSADAVADQISESDFVKSVQVATAAQTVMTTFSSSAAVVANSVQVYLNGLLQEEGGTEDYTIVTSTGVVTFIVGLDAGDVVTLMGVLDN